MGTNVLHPENAIMVVRGATATFKLTITDADNKPVDITNATAYFTVKREIGEQNPVIRKSTASSAEIEIVSAKGGIIRIYLVPGDTKNLYECQYVFDVWIVLATGQRYPVVRPSLFEVLDSVTVLA